MVNVKRTIELITNFAIILVCGLLVWTYVTHKTIRIGVHTGEQDEAYLEGATLAQLPGYNWGSHAKTLVLALRSGCHYCEDNFAFYRRLSEQINGANLPVHLLAVMPDEKESGSNDLRLAGLSIDSVFKQSLDSVKVKATPTLLLVNSRGRVSRAWVGELTEERQDDVIAAVRK